MSLQRLGLLLLALLLIHTSQKTYAAVDSQDADTKAIENYKRYQAMDAKSKEELAKHWAEYQKLDKSEKQRAIANYERYQALPNDEKERIKERIERRRESRNERNRRKR